MVALQVELARKFLPSIKDAGAKTLRLAIEIRRELNIQTDPVAMEAEMREQWKRMDESVERLFSGLAVA